MQQIKVIENEISELKRNIEECKSWQNTERIEELVKSLQEKIEIRKQFIQAIIKNIETNKEYVNQQEEALKRFRKY